VNLLASHHQNGLRFEPLEFIEKGSRVAVRLAVSRSRWSDGGETYKVFTFREESCEAVLMQDTMGRDHAQHVLDDA
jgi:hypothetical protein